jgi:hypothetical protein
MRKLSTDLIKSGSFTGSFSGSIIGTITSASYSLTSSYVAGGFNLTTGSTYSITSSWSNNSISSSYANTASNLSPIAQDLIPYTSSTYSLGSPTNKWKDIYVSSGSVYIGNTVLSTSASILYVDINPVVTFNTASGQIQVAGITASLSASFSNTSSLANTASYVLNSISSSYALTASYAMNGGGGGTSLITGSTYPITSSWSNNAITASYALNASGGGGGTVQTGSIANQTILYNVTTSQENTITGLDLSGNKWNVAVIEEWNSASIVGDAYYNSCSLLLHFSGSNGSTTFIDNSPNNFTVTAANGAAISTTQNKFGGASGYFDGSDDYINIPDNSVFDFGSGDFTIEYWEYRTSSDNNRTVMSRKNVTYTPYMVGYAWNGTLAFYASSNGSSWTIVDLKMGSIILNTWTHYAVTRQGNTFRTFQNGTLIASTTSTDTFPAGSSAVEIGKWSIYYFAGYLDELRITKGVARYTGSFTTSSIEFSNNASVNQYETKYVGLVGGLNDTTVDYGVEKLSDSSLKIRKMSVSGTPISGSPVLSASVDRVYVNVLNYNNVQTTAQSASYATTASYALNASGSGGGATLTTGSTYPITSSWSNNSISSSYVNLNNISSQLAKAWVNFNGTGTVAIRDSYNVSSITDNGTGDYTVNFSTALNNSNYCALGSSRVVIGTRTSIIGFSNYTTTSIRLETINLTNQLQDEDTNCVAIFSN